MIETPQVAETHAQLVATIHIETPRSQIQPNLPNSSPGCFGVI